MLLVTFKLFVTSHDKSLHKYVLLTCDGPRFTDSLSSFECLSPFLTPFFKSTVQGLQTTGALDLGGASTQISFVSDTFDGSESPLNSVAFRLYGNDYNLYTHSFLCYGKDQALKMVLAQQTQVGL